jgi:isoaspartyl peptidase/L-asparaginase-like protein (Ntn-hydrolase superfamily)
MHRPLILSTWSFGKRANAAAWETLAADKDGASLDAVELACRDAEADVANHTVGFSGYPDASGAVTLDASIMLAPRMCGSVAYVKHFVHVISIARRVMEKTPHVLLAGYGAELFAIYQGFTRQDPLTDDARNAWKQWRDQQKADGSPSEGLQKRNIEELGLQGADRGVSEANHDTIGVLAIDSAGILAGGCTTSGLRFKLPGRVGDSPIIGHGLYVDPSAGAAVATGHGELVMGVCGSFLAVEKMRAGASAQEAAEFVVQRIASSYELTGEDQVGIITLRPDGSWGSAALRDGFRVAARDEKSDELLDSHHVLLKS